MDFVRMVEQSCGAYAEDQLQGEYAAYYRGICNGIDDIVASMDGIADELCGPEGGVMGELRRRVMQELIDALPEYVESAKAETLIAMLDEQGG